MISKPGILRNFVWHQRERRLELTVERDGVEVIEVIRLEGQQVPGTVIQDLLHGIGKPVDELFKDILEDESK